MVQQSFEKTLTRDSTYIFSSFTPWSYKIAWIRTSVSRAHKICSNKTFLSAEIIDQHYPQIYVLERIF